MADAPSSLLQRRIRQFTNDERRADELIALLTALVSETAALEAVSGAGSLNGLGLSWINTDQISVAAGSARDDTDTLTVVLASPVTVTMPTHLLPPATELANTLYHLWLLGDSSGTNAPIVRFDPSATAPSLPGTHDLQRRLGAVRNGPGSGFLSFTQAGTEASRWMEYDARGLDTRVLNNGVDVTYTTIDASAFVPPQARLIDLRVDYACRAASQALLLRQFGSAETVNDAIKPGIVLTTQMNVRNRQAVDTGRFQYRLQAPLSGSDLDLYVRGYLDRLVP